MMHALPSVRWCGPSWSSPQAAFSSPQEVFSSPRSSPSTPSAPYFSTHKGLVENCIQSCVLRNKLPYVNFDWNFYLLYM